MDKIAFIDLETTGTDIVKDRIVQIALLRMTRTGPLVHWEPEPTICRLINPGVPIPLEASAIHGITDDTVKDQPTFAQIANSLHSLLDGYMFGGFNSDRFDIPLLAEEFLRCSIILPRMKSVDVMRFYHKKNPRDLSSAVEHYTGEKMIDAHNAAADIEATAAVFLCQQDQDSVYDLHEYMKVYAEDGAEELDYAGKIIRNKNGQIVFNFGKEKGNLVASPSARGFAEWCLKADFISRDTKAIIQGVINGKIV